VRGDVVIIGRGDWGGRIIELLGMRRRGGGLDFR